MPKHGHFLRARRRILTSCLAAALCLAACVPALADHDRPHPPASKAATGTGDIDTSIATPVPAPVGDLRLVASRTVLNPGDTVTFSLDVPDTLKSRPLPMALRDGEGYMELSRQAPYRWTMTLPHDRVGKRVWQVVALGGSSQHQSNPVEIQVGSQADRLARLEFAENTAMELRPGDYLPTFPALTAHYRDGGQCQVLSSDEVQWRIVAASQASKSTAGEPLGISPVVQVGGCLLALRPGQVHLVATLGKASATRTIRVAAHSPTDADGDLLTDADERRYGTDPYSRDTDADGSTDELEYGIDQKDGPHPLDMDADGTPDMLQANLRVFPGFNGQALGVWISDGRFHNGRGLSPGQLPSPDSVATTVDATVDYPAPVDITGNGLTLSIADLPTGGHVHVRVYGLSPLAEISRVMTHNAFSQPSWTRLTTANEGDAITFDLVDGDPHDRDPSLGQIEILLSAIPTFSPVQALAVQPARPTSAARWLAFLAVLLGTAAFVFVRARRRRAHAAGPDAH